MEKKQKIVIKNMISLSDVLADVLDDRYKKLSDMYKDLELSHNRKKKALKQILTLVSHNDFDVCVADLILDICNRALFSDGKVKGVF